MEPTPGSTDRTQGVCGVVGLDCADGLEREIERHPATHTTLNTLLLKHISHAHGRTTTFPAIPPLEPDWTAPKPVTSYTRIHRVGIRRVELGGYFFGSLEWTHCLAPSTAGREFVAWCVLTVPMA